MAHDYKTAGDRSKIFDSGILSKYPLNKLFQIE
jgi:hypothetical protein